MKLAQKAVGNKIEDSSTVGVCPERSLEEMTRKGVAKLVQLTTINR